MPYSAALVTGATSGIGAAFARTLPIETNLVLTGRDKERLELLSGELARPQRAVTTVVADLTTTDGRTAVTDCAKRAKIDLFICNAGLAYAGPFVGTSLASEHASMSVNIVATVELLHALIPGMVAQARQSGRRAAVIIVSSTAAFKHSAGVATYGASKAFQLHLARSLALELAAEPIDVLALCPSYTRTEFFARAGLPAPQDAMAPEAVAAEALAAIGHRTIQICGSQGLPQPIYQAFALNPLLDIRRWPRRIVALLKRGLRR